MSELWSRSYPEEELDALKHNAELIVTPQVGTGGPENVETRNKSLRRMRLTLINKMNVMVAVGGKLHTDDGNVPGVAEEMDLARTRGIGCFLVGGLGGMASNYAKGLTSSEVLQNSLSPEENDLLFKTDDVASTVNIIFEKLARSRSLLNRRLKNLE